jgi:hypothetical protein
MQIQLSYRSERTPQNRFRPKAVLTSAQAGSVIQTTEISDSGREYLTEDEAEEYALRLALSWRDHNQPQVDLLDKKNNLRYPGRAP